MLDTTSTIVKLVDAVQASIKCYRPSKFFWGILCAVYY